MGETGRNSKSKNRMTKKRSVIHQPIINNKTREKKKEDFVHVQGEGERAKAPVFPQLLEKTLGQEGSKWGQGKQILGRQGFLKHFRDEDGVKGSKEEKRMGHKSRKQPLTGIAGEGGRGTNGSQKTVLALWLSRRMCQKKLEDSFFERCL